MAFTVTKLNRHYGGATEIRSVPACSTKPVQGDKAMPKEWWEDRSYEDGYEYGQNSNVLGDMGMMVANLMGLSEINQDYVDGYTDGAEDRGDDEDA